MAEYLYDALGHWAAKIVDGVTTYVVDHAGYLVIEERNVGNRQTASNVTSTIAHNLNNELTRYGDLEYEYDANGNMIEQRSATQSLHYIYNVANRLIRIEDEGSGTVIAEYGYDPFGRRLWKDVDGTRTYFLYADEGLVAEYDENGQELRTYGYQPDSIWTTNPLWLKEGDEYYWYQNDHLGTPQKLIDINGTVVWAAQYTAFGEAQIQIETVTNHLRFPGQYFDAETGWHYNYQRFYVPHIARYSQIDPIGFAGGDMDLYAYVWNNPGNWLDPWGLSERDVWNILQTAWATKRHLNETGQRHNNPFYNNFMSGVGSSYLACGDQWNRVYMALTNQDFDDPWKFTSMESLEEFGVIPYIHVFGMAVSANNNDPIIIIDIWRDSYIAIGRKIPVSEYDEIIDRANSGITWLIFDLPEVNTCVKDQVCN